MKKQLRAVVGARVSVLKGDEKVSHIAQHETGFKWAKAHDAIVIDTFEDLDVSATISPFNRPDLGPWLSDLRAHEWDAMVWSKIDRAFRDPKDSVNVASWAEERKKVLVFADDGLMLDFRDDADPMARMMAETFLLMGSMFAKWELRRFQGRALDAHRVLRHMDRWAGGTPPEGYTTAPHPSGKGRTLVKDPERQAMLHKAAALLLDEETNWSFNAIAGWLSDQGYETTKDYHRKPEKKQGTRWSAAQVIGMFTSLNTQGVKMMGQGKANKPVLDEDGNMIQLAEPTFDPLTWARIQEAVARRRYGSKSRTFGNSPLGDVVYCGKCLHKARHRVTQHSYGQYRYYNCGNTLKGCTGVNSKAPEIEALVEQTFLEACGDRKVRRRVFVPGEDHTEELEKVKRIIDALREDREMGLIMGEEDELRYRRQMKSLLEQRATLEKLPQRKPGWDVIEDEITYREKWEKADTEARRKLLVDAGVRILLHGQNNWEVQIPEDLLGRLTGVVV